MARQQGQAYGIAGRLVKGQFSPHRRQHGEAASHLMALLWQGNPSLVKIQ